jgi:hypothetical protein
MPVCSPSGAQQLSGTVCKIIESIVACPTDIRKFQPSSISESFTAKVTLDFLFEYFQGIN